MENNYDLFVCENCGVENDTVFFCGDYCRSEFYYGLAESTKNCESCGCTDPEIDSSLYQVIEDEEGYVIGFKEKEV
jgi:Uri superfamily endonuclease